MLIQVHEKTWQVLPPTGKCLRFSFARACGSTKSLGCQKNGQNSCYDLRMNKTWSYMIKTFKKQLQFLEWDKTTIQDLQQWIKSVQKSMIIVILCDLWRTCCYFRCWSHRYFLWDRRHLSIRFLNLPIWFLFAFFIFLHLSTSVIWRAMRRTSSSPTSTTTWQRNAVKNRKRLFFRMRRPTTSKATASATCSPEINNCWIWWYEMATKGALETSLQIQVSGVGPWPAILEGTVKQ